VELNEHQINWNAFPYFKQKPDFSYYDEYYTLDGQTMLYAQKKFVTNKKNPPREGAWSTNNNRPEGYANYVPGYYYIEASRAKLFCVDGLTGADLGTDDHWTAETGTVAEAAAGTNTGARSRDAVIGVWWRERGEKMAASANADGNAGASARGEIAEAMSKGGGSAGSTNLINIDNLTDIGTVTTASGATITLRTAKKNSSVGGSQQVRTEVNTANVIYGSGTTRPYDPKDAVNIVTTKGNCAVRKDSDPSDSGEDEVDDPAVVTTEDAGSDNAAGGLSSVAADVRTHTNSAPTSPVGAVESQNSGACCTTSPGVTGLPSTQIDSGTAYYLQYQWLQQMQMQQIQVQQWMAMQQYRCQLQAQQRYVASVGTVEGASAVNEEKVNDTDSVHGSRSATAKTESAEHPSGAKSTKPAATLTFIPEHTDGTAVANVGSSGVPTWRSLVAAASPGFCAGFGACGSWTPTPMSEATTTAGTGTATGSVLNASFLTSTPMMSPVGKANSGGSLPASEAKLLVQQRSYLDAVLTRGNVCAAGDKSAEVDVDGTGASADGDNGKLVRDAAALEPSSSHAVDDRKRSYRDAVLSS
jgi:hypothetical protein